MKLKRNLLNSFFMVLVLSSCNEPYSQDKCESISMEMYKGSPNSAHEFKSHCKGVKNNYPKEKCQKALSKLIMGTQAESLKKEFGSKIMGCFGEDEIKKWLNK